jgi:DNA polymerase III subunit epsilon
VNFTAIDFETASSEKGSACAVGIVRVENSEVKEEVYSLIKPFSAYFDPACVRVHGLTWEDVRTAPTFVELWPQLKPLLSGRLILAHNASFDLKVLKSALDAYGLPYPEASYNCTVQIAKKTWPEFYNYKLSTIAYELDISFKHHHALEDAQAAAEIMLRAEEIHNAFDEETFLKRLRMSNGSLFPGLSTTPGANQKRKNLALSAETEKKEAF